MTKEYIEELLRNEETVKFISQIRVKFTRNLTISCFLEIFRITLSTLKIHMGTGYDKELINKDGKEFIVAIDYLEIYEDGKLEEKVKFHYDYERLYLLLQKYNLDNDVGMLLSADNLIQIFIDLLGE